MGMCPNNGFEALKWIHIFCNGLQQQHKQILDATISGSLMGKSHEEAIGIIEVMSVGDQQGQHGRGNP
ncbi:hypothetical protein Lal_00013415 [Lupinus albus]|nr:hypothetical protein Lal_00013415 [Lupinus albus]